MGHGQANDVTRSGAQLTEPLAWENSTVLQGFNRTDGHGSTLPRSSGRAISPLAVDGEDAAGYRHGGPGEMTDRRAGR